MSEKLEKKQAQMLGMDSGVLKTGSTLSEPGGGAAGTETRVYIGPDIPGAKQYTVFNNGLPENLKKRAGRSPFFNSLIIPVKKLAQASAELDTEGSALNILFKKAAKEIQEG